MAAKRKTAWEMASIKLDSMKKLRDDIAKKRDKLREDSIAFDDIFSAVDNASDDIDQGIRLIQDAVCQISEFV